MDNEFGVYDDISDCTDQFLANGMDVGVEEQLNSSAWFERSFKSEDTIGEIRTGGDTMVVIRKSVGNDPHYVDCHVSESNGQSLEHKVQYDQQQRCHDQQRDDGYGSQTIIVSNVTDTTGDNLYPYTRERCHTWPTAQQSTDEGRGSDQHYAKVYRRDRHHNPFSPPAQPSRGSSGLSLISESNESISSSVQMTTLAPMKVERNELQQWAGNFDGHHNGPISSPPLAESASRRSSVSESVEDNRGVAKAPGSTVAMSSYKSGHPSYVELITQAIHSSPEQRMTLSEIYDWMAGNVPAFKDQRYLHSSSGWKNSVRHNLSLHSRFKRVKRNGMDKPSWWTVDMSEEIKRERPNKRSSKQCRPRANTTVAAVQHSVQHNKAAPRKDVRCAVAAQGQPNLALSNLGSSAVYSADGRAVPPQRRKVDAGGVTLTSSAATVPPSESFEAGSEIMAWSHEEKNLKTDNGQHGTPLDQSKLRCLSQSITVSLCESSLEDGLGGASKPDVALTMVLSDDSSNPTLQHQSSTGACGVKNLVNALSEYTLEERTHQLLRVKTSAGRVQEVALPVPMPIKVVMNSNKGCQTDPPKSVISDRSSSQSWQRSSIPRGQVVNFGGSGGNVACNQQTATVEPINVDTPPLFASPQQQQQMMISPTIRQDRPGIVTLSQQQSLAEPSVAEEGPNQQGLSPLALAARDVSNAPLPDDLAMVDVRDSFDCNIMDILSYEMNCNGQNGNNVSGLD